MPKHETITGAEIRVGDVIQSAAMTNRPHKVTAAHESSTGNTIEIETAIASKYADGTWGEFEILGRDYRIGKSSKVKRFTAETMEIPAIEIRKSDTIIENITSGVDATVEIEEIESTYTTHSETQIVSINGYRIIPAGVCGPWGRTYRADERVTVRRVS